MSAGEATGVDSNALARTLSSSHDVAALQEKHRSDERTAEGDANDNDDAGQDSASSSASVPRPEPAGSGGIFAGLLGDEGALENLSMSSQPSSSAPPSSSGSAEGSALDLGLDDELRDFSLPSTTPGAAALSPAKKAPSIKRSIEPVAPKPPPPPAPEVSASLGDDALDALGAAFDTLASQPAPARAGGGLTDDERAFLAGMAGAQPPPPPPTATPVRPPKPPPRPPEKPGVPRAAPPPRRKKPAASASPRGASTKLAISEEARAAAFLPLKRASSSPVIGDGIEFPDGIDPTERPAKQRTKADPEITAPNQIAAPMRARPDNDEFEEPPSTLPLATTTGEHERPAPRKAKRPVREQPTVWRGLNKVAIAAAVVVGLLGGGAIGASTAPVPAKRNDGRARAELAVADGNRYYEVARFDDAVGKYKNAVNNDRTYAPAHRAKGAALAKLAQAAQTTQPDQAQRLWDEAAEAYQEYLLLEPSAIDAADIKEALKRRGKKPVSTEGARD